VIAERRLYGEINISQKEIAHPALFEKGLEETRVLTTI